MKKTEMIQSGFLIWKNTMNTTVRSVTKTVTNNLFKTTGNLSSDQFYVKKFNFYDRLS